MRHPCIVAVMGAVAAGRGELGLVVELMELGSLADLLQNSMFELDADFVAQARGGGW